MCLNVFDVFLMFLRNIPPALGVSTLTQTTRVALLQATALQAVADNGHPPARDGWPWILLTNKPVRTGIIDRPSHIVSIANTVSYISYYYTIILLLL